MTTSTSRYLAITGPKAFYRQASYAITDLPAETTIRWKCRNDKTNIISGQGTPTINVSTTIPSGGYQEVITAQIIRNDLVISEINYPVMVGFHITSIEYFQYLGYNVLIANTTLGENSEVSATWETNANIIEFPYSYDASFIGREKCTAAITANKSGVYHVCAHAKFHNDISLAYCRDVYIQANQNNRSFTLSPNPAGDVVTLRLMETDRESGESILSTARSMYEIQLWSGMTMLRSYKTNEPTFQIPVAGLPAGLYFVRLVKDGEVHTEKLIKN